MDMEECDKDKLAREKNKQRTTSFKRSKREKILEKVVEKREIKLLYHMEICGYF